MNVPGTELTLSCIQSLIRNLYAHKTLKPEVSSKIIWQQSLTSVSEFGNKTSQALT